MTEFLNIVKQNQEFRQDVSNALVEFNKESLTARAQTGAILLAQNKAWQTAGRIMAEEITELTDENENLLIENTGLRHIIGNNLNEEQLKKYCVDEKAKLGSTSDKNRKILNRLTNRLLSSKSYIEKSCCDVPALTQLVISQPKQIASPQAVANKK